MLKDFFKRIVVEVIKELISPELNAIREELKKETSAIREELKKETSAIREELKKETSAIREELKKETSAIREELKKETTLIRAELSEMKEDIRHLDRRLDDLYKVVVRREEHYSLEEDVKRLRDDVEVLKRRVGV